jgi:hypothetical protein
MILKAYDSVSEDRSQEEQKKVVNRIFDVQNEVQNNSEHAKRPII